MSWAGLSAGRRLGDRYRLDVRIGSGGMGEVWRAVDEVLGRPVAVKVMLAGVADDPDFARRFLAEATAMARVNHPAVASIHDYGRSHDVTFLVMELVDGESLAQVLARVGRLGPADTMRLIAQAADGLQAVHDCGIVHRDIKPANLLIRRDGSVVITDFGIARHDDAGRLTASGAILGTPSYLSPEQVLGRPVTARSDVYALGLTAYECLAGARPFVGDNPYAVALQRLQSAPRTIGVTLPAAVLAVLERALATDPADRWPTASALAAAARDTGGATPGGSRSVPPPPAGAAPRRRPVALVAALLAILLVGGGAAAWAISRHRGPAGSAVAAPRESSSAKASASGSGGSLGAVLQQAGFTACGTAFCPAETMCWGGLTDIGGQGLPPQRVDCAKSHYWETFAVIELPGDATGADPETLMKRADVATVCSAQAMASSSRRPDATRSWRRDAWPIPLAGNGIWLLHCLAEPTTGESIGSAFQPPRR